MVVSVLGIDPGLQHTGWGIISSHQNNNTFIACGTIHTPTKAPLAERLTILHHKLNDILTQHAPNEAAIEETFVNNNALSSLKLGHARGCLMMTLALTGLPISEYAPNQIKKAVCGAGKADKSQVAAMVSLLLPRATPDSPDATDALAIALCHAHARTLMQQLA